MRRIVRLAAILNLTYFGVEFAVALAIGSVSLFADSIDFLEDTTVNEENKVITAGFLKRVQREVDAVVDCR
jgi:divalent metal cation (Fe/Co/Zn/Cd) transporter